MTNSAKLRDIISKSGLKYKYLASRIGLSACGLQRKIDNHSEFKTREINALCDSLGIVSPELKEQIFLHNP